MEENLGVCKVVTGVMQLWKRMASSQDTLDQVILSQTRITSIIRETNPKTSLRMLFAGLVICIQEIKT